MKLSCERTIRQQTTIIQCRQEMLAIFTLHLGLQHLLCPSDGGILVLRAIDAPMQSRIHPLISTRHSVADVFLVTSSDLDHINFSGSGSFTVSIIGWQQPQSFTM